MHLFNLKKSLVFLYICLVALLAAVTFVETCTWNRVCRKVCLSYSLVLLFRVLAALAVAVLLSGVLWRRLPTLLLHGPSSLSWWEP